jgi:GTP-binding protein HflX
MEVTLPPDKLGLTDFVYRKGTVLERRDNEDGSVSMEILTTEAARDEIEGRLGRPLKR